MLLLRAIILSIQLYGFLAVNLELNQLIEKVNRLCSDSATVYFVGVEDEFLSDFMKTHSSVPVSIFRSTAADINIVEHTNTILVFQVPEKINTNNSNISDVPSSLIAKLSVRKFVIVIASSVDFLNQYFLNFAKNKFTRIFGISGNIGYAYLPYAEIQVQQLLLSDCDPLPDAMKDLNGFSFRTIVQYDVPRSLWYTDKEGRKQLGGSLAPIIPEFFKRFNATFEEVLINNSSLLNIPGVMNATLEHRVDISMNAYTPQTGIDFSYPITMEDYVIMVPRNGYVAPHEYFQRPFSLGAWLCVGLTLAYITIIKVILDMCLHTEGADYWSAFSGTFLIFLNLSTERPITSAYRLHLQVLLFAFIIGSLYNIHFTSFLTAYIPIKQFDTFEDLEKNNVFVLMPSYEVNQVSELYPSGLKNLIVPLNHTTLFYQLYAMQNTSYAYAVGGDRCEFLIGLQTFLSGKSLFRKAREIIKFSYLGFLLAFHSPFKDILNDFIIEIQQTGLLLKWKSDTVWQAKQIGFALYMDYFIDRGKINEQLDQDQEVHKPLRLKHLQFAWSCLVIGLTLATMVFIGERFVRRSSPNTR